VLSTIAHYPIWSRDGKEIYYMGLEGTIWAAEVRGSGPTLTTAAPKPLFRATGIAQPRAFDVARDGRPPGGAGGTTRNEWRRRTQSKRRVLVGLVAGSHSYPGC
jgi:hypothetical protein